MYLRSRSSGGAVVWLTIAMIAINIFIAGTWIVNAYKLVNCDWKEGGSWKGEIIHAIGIVPGVSVFTAFNNDK